MARTVHDAFNEYRTWLQVSGTELNNVNSRPASIETYLGKPFNDTSDMPLLRTELIGSADRGTLIHPVDDVDVFAIFDPNKGGAWNKYASNSKTFIYRVRDALAGYQVEIVGTRGQVVRLFYKSGPHVEIAPVFKLQSGGFYLPNGSGGWLTTDPPRQSEWINKRDQELGGHLKSLIRVAKAWNRAHSAHFKSFHLEVMVATALASLDGNSRTALQILFSNARYFIDVLDPAGHGGNLSSYMTPARRHAALAALGTAAERARRAVEAENQNDPAEAIRLWGVNLGAGFPTYG